MTTNQKQFALFKKECRKWFNRFHLNGWRIDFFLTPLPNKEQSEIILDYLACVGTAQLDTTISKTAEDSYSKVIKDIAKHEMIHGLLGNFAAVARMRFVTARELEKAEEELVVKLECIIK